MSKKDSTNNNKRAKFLQNQHRQSFVAKIVKSINENKDLLQTSYNLEFRESTSGS
ncbi:35448_t:CDS:2 [Gigaspora margarita]|uniref:35448_t:CDS:1 n=1 Tax=Gigaspora margarita TaxID=4874 RepID=A0ABN7ULS7_GIGMA|nr:35448_t:CDS:2 [Gigaspora margarita]